MTEDITPVINSGKLVVCEHFPEEVVYRLVLSDTTHMDLAASGPMKGAPGSSMYVFSKASRFQINVPEDKFEKAMADAGLETAEDIKDVTFVTASDESYHDILDDEDAPVSTISFNDPAH